MVARQQDYVRIYDLDKNLQGPEMYLCVRFGCSKLIVYRFQLLRYLKSVSGVSHKTITMANNALMIIFINKVFSL